MKYLFLVFLSVVAKVFYHFRYHMTSDFTQNTSGKIIAPNHISSIDALFIWIMCRGNCTVVASLKAVQAKNFIIRFCARFFDIIYVTENDNISATRTMIKVLSSGKTLLIFPEGTITPDGNLSAIEEGTVFISQKSKTKIYPVKIDGLLGSKFSKVHNHSTVRVSAMMKDAIDPTLFVGKEGRTEMNALLKEYLNV